MTALLLIACTVAAVTIYRAAVRPILRALGVV